MNKLVYVFQTPAEINETSVYHGDYKLARISEFHHKETVSLSREREYCGNTHNDKFYDSVATRI